MSLSRYVIEHTIRGSCRCGRCTNPGSQSNADQDIAESTFHTVDIVFFEVSIKDNPTKEEFLDLVKEHYPQWLDGKEHSYLEIGGDIGDQGLALTAMALGNILGAWELLTPKTMIPDISDALATQIAGSGMITIIYKDNENNI